MGEGHAPHTRLTRIGVVLGAGLLLGGCTSGAAESSPVVSASTTPSPAATRPSPTIGAPSPRPSSSSSIGVLASTTEISTQQPVGSILVEMTGPPPRFVPSKLSTPAGDVVFFLDNTSPVRDPHASHSLAIGTERDHPLAVSDLVDGGRSAVFTVRGLEPGEYTIWCTFPAHAGLGQVGTLTVT